MTADSWSTVRETMDEALQRAARGTADLPEGWICRNEPTSGRPYYFDIVNHRAQWEHPADVWIADVTSAEQSIDEAASMAVTTGQPAHNKAATSSAGDGSRITATSTYSSG